MAVDADQFKIVFIQGNPVVGDLDGNCARLIAAWREAADRGADLVITSELYISGYPPEDLVLDGMFRACLAAVPDKLLRAAPASAPALAFGYPAEGPDADRGRLYNSLMILDGGVICDVIYKVHLPNYGVFDEKRLFTAGPPPRAVTIRGLRCGFMICEDMWEADIAAALARDGAEVLIVVNGSPFERGKTAQRYDHAQQRIDETGLPLAYVNQIGGQDELVFDGGSFVVNADGDVAARAPTFVEHALTTNWCRGERGCFCIPQGHSARHENVAEIYHALILGFGDYVRKNGFEKIIIGLSGGIDSAFVATLAVDALGSESVIAVMLPSRYTSAASRRDATACARMLGLRLEEVSIAAAARCVEGALGLLFADCARDITEENIQSRLRGVMIMALANKFGGMAVTTGNKSELAVGYATLYGDMNGGFNPIKDIYKSEIYALARWRNAHSPDGIMGPRGMVIPEAILSKPPSAELRPDQKDSDSLPDYELLDGVLEGLIERRDNLDDLVAAGFDRGLVLRIADLLHRSEHKRRQAPLGIKIGTSSFGRDWRYPVTNRFIAETSTREGEDTDEQ